jgi:hypothetical protein
MGIRASYSKLDNFTFFFLGHIIESRGMRQEAKGIKKHNFDRIPYDCHYLVFLASMLSPVHFESF